jgi:S-adenosylmethionine hydrolase
LFTDFGWAGPYVGQMAAAVMQVEASIPLVHLMHDAPTCRPELAAYLLPACCRNLPRGSVVVAVVDPGVGGERDALVVETDRLSLVGPDNGLLSRFGDKARISRLTWQPENLSASFHGRDLFAPAAAMLALDQPPSMEAVMPAGMVGSDWRDEVRQIIYIDGFGNAMTGVRADSLSTDCALVVGGRRIVHARTFCDVRHREVFWYENSLGLVEVAANAASAANLLSLALGDGFLID